MKKTFFEPSKINKWFPVALTLIIAIAFTSCASRPNLIPTPTTPPTNPPTKTISQIPIPSTPSHTPEPTAEPSPKPSLTPTQISYRGFAQIQPANVEQLSLLTSLNDGYPKEMAWRADGEALAVCTLLGVDIFTLEPFEKAYQLNKNQPCTAISWSPDSTHLAIGIQGGKVQFINTSTWQEAKIFDSELAEIYDIAWAVKTNRIALGGMDGSVSVIASPLDTPDAKPIQIMPFIAGGVLVEWSPEGDWLATGNANGRLILWDSHDLSQFRLTEGHNAAIKDLSWSPDGRFLASSSEDGNIRIWDPNEIAPIQDLSGFGPIAWSADRKTLFFSNQERIVKQLVHSQQKTSNLGREKLLPQLLELTQSGEKVAVLDQNGVLSILDSKNGQYIARYLQYGNPITSLAIAPDGDHYAAITSKGRLTLWNASTGKVQSTLEGTAVYANHLSWSPDGELLALAGQYDTVRVFDLKTEQILADLVLPIPTLASSIAFSADSQFLAVGQTNGDINIWRRDTWQTETTLGVLGDSTIESLCWSPDGTKLAAGDELGILRLWDPWKEQSLGWIEGQASSVLSIAFSSDSKTIATAGSDGFVFLWDAQSNQLRAKLNDDGCQMNKIQWSPDGSMLSGVDSCGNLKIWDRQSFQLLKSVRDAGNALYGLDWSQDGRSILTAGLDGVLRIWGLPE